MFLHCSIILPLLFYYFLLFSIAFPCVALRCVAFRCTALALLASVSFPFLASRRLASLSFTLFYLLLTLIHIILFYLIPIPTTLPFLLYLTSTYVISPCPSFPLLPLLSFSFPYKPSLLSHPEFPLALSCLVLPSFPLSLPFLALPCIPLP